jgi:hypothetical protein
MSSVSKNNAKDEVTDTERGYLKYHYEDDGSLVVERATVNKGYTLVLGGAIGFVDSVLLVRFLQENAHA